MLSPTDLARLAIASARDRRRALKRVVIGRADPDGDFEQAVKNALRSLGAEAVSVEVRAQEGPTRIIALELHRSASAPDVSGENPRPPPEKQS